MKNLELGKCILGSVRTNTYFLKNKEINELLIIDPAACPDQIIATINKMQAKPVGILLTHGHFDHILAVDDIRKEYNIPVYASEKEKNTLSDPMINLTGMGMKATTVKADQYLKDLDVFEAAGFKIQMLATPGHTEGSCCYYISEENVLFSGDTLFCGSVGRTDFPTGSMGEITRSVRRLVDSLPEETEVFPGHDSATTIGYEKRNNPFV